MNITPFHEVVIGGLTFQGVLSADGPAIQTGFTGLALGRATSIRYVGALRGHDDGSR